MQTVAWLCDPPDFCGLSRSNMLVSLILPQKRGR